ncbi:MAG TPA: helix-turn-helix transcriptional regulator [Conexibacter sp.]|jgi:DNA-binding CsgD family transcriptional regulator|nr:helix-turn-helix transcriptional regulator [Conexibacter sp.]
MEDRASPRADPLAVALVQQRRALLEEGVRRGEAGAAIVQALCRAQLALLASDDDGPAGGAPLVLAAAAAVRASAALRLGDVAAARQRLGEAAWLLAGTPGATDLRDWLDALRAQADAAADSAFGGGWALTTAELRVLQLLPTHLSYPDIARRLFVSPNTVKTHARAVYRKLDACSRAEAVRRARGAGLLDLEAAA